MIFLTITALPDSDAVLAQATSTQTKERLRQRSEEAVARGIFGAPNMPKDAVEWYIGFLKKVYDAPEFKKYLTDGALKPAFATGAEYVKWVEENDQHHRDLMAKGGLLKK